ncbi:MAG: NfeD family protein [Arenicella sp.]
MLEALTVWHWLSIAGVLLIAELLLGAEFLLWLAFPAVMSAGVAYIAPGMDWRLQVLLYIVFSIVSLLVWNKYYRGRMLKKTDQPHLNQRQNQFVGRSFTLVDILDNAEGKIVVDDSQWRVRISGEFQKAKKGDQVKVVDVDGMILLVELV